MTCSSMKELTLHMAIVEKGQQYAGNYLEKIFVKKNVNKTANITVPYRNQWCGYI